MKISKHKTYLNVSGINYGICYVLIFSFVFTNIASIAFNILNIDNFNVKELFLNFIYFIGAFLIYGILPIFVITLIFAIPATFLLLKLDRLTSLNTAFIGATISISWSYLENKDFLAIIFFGFLGFIWGWVFIKGYLKGSQK